MKPSAKAAVVLFAVFTCAYFAAAITAARSMALSTDEVFVIWIMRVFPAGKVVFALTKGVDSLPPGYYLLLKAVCHFLGINALAIRLPSIIAFYAFLLSIFCLLRKHTGPLIAVFAMAIPCMTEAAFSATLARPYAIVTACFGLAAVLWTAEDSSKNPPLWRAALLTLLLAIAIGVHFYAVLLVVVLALMEFVRSLRDRRICRLNWAAMTAGGATVFAWWPVVGPIYRTTHSSTSAAGFYARPSLSALIDKLGKLLAQERMLYSLVVFLCLAALLPVIAPLLRKTWLRFCESEPQANEASSGDLRIVIFGAILLPVVTLVFASLVTRSFNTRYFYAAVLGLCLPAGLALRRMPFGALLSVCMTLVFTVFFAASSLRHAALTDQRIVTISHTPEPLPIVAGDASDLFELMESAPPPLRKRLVFANMPAGSVSPDPEPQLVANIWKGFLPDLQVVDAAPFFAQNPAFYLLFTGSAREGMTDWLVAHSRITLAGRAPGVWLLHVDSVNPR